MGPGKSLGRSRRSDHLSPERIRFICCLLFPEIGRHLLQGITTYPPNFPPAGTLHGTAGSAPRQGQGREPEQSPKNTEINQMT